MTNKDIVLFLNNIVARAEAVLEESKNRKLHEPTVEFYRGQKLLAEQLLHNMEGPEDDEQVLRGEIDKGKLRIYDEDGAQIDVLIDNGYK